MEINEIKKALGEVRLKGPKRKFNQSIDLIINLRNLDIKKNPISNFYSLKHKVKDVKVCCFSDETIGAKASEIFDRTITKNMLNLLNDKKEIRKLAKDYDYFIAQADLMPLVASKLGKYFGSRGKMPSPAAGCVFLPNADLLALKEKLQTLRKLHTKNEAVLRVCVGKEELKDEDVVENISDVYNHILALLPEGKNNIKNVILKLTMGAPYKIGTGFSNDNKDIPLENKPLGKKEELEKKESSSKEISERKMRKKEVKNG